MCKLEECVITIKVLTVEYADKLVGLLQSMVTKGERADQESWLTVEKVYETRWDCCTVRVAPAE